MIASVALKDTRGAAVIRDVKVQTPTVATTLKLQLRAMVLSSCYC